MSKQPVRRIAMKFDDNALVPMLFGEHDYYLSLIEEEMDVDITARGNEVIINGPKSSLPGVQSVFDVLWERLQKGLPVDRDDVLAAIQVAKSPMNAGTRR